MTAHKSIPAGLLILAILMFGLFRLTTADAQEAADAGRVNDRSFQPVDTSSPRATLASFIRLTEEAEDKLGEYREKNSLAIVEDLALLGDQYEQLLDLSMVPAASRREFRGDRLGILLDVIGRIQLPPLEDVPGADAFATEGSRAEWQIPGTPIEIVRIEDGPRELEFLFSARTLRRLPELYERIEHIPLRSSIGIESWQLTIQGLHGPMIPKDLVTALPDSFKEPWLGTPVWKVLFVGIMAAFAVVFLRYWRRFTRPRGTISKPLSKILHMLTPIATVAIITILQPLITNHLNLAGAFAIYVDSAASIILYLMAAWIFWLIVSFSFEWIIWSPRIADESLDADLLRLSAQMVGLLGGSLIIGFGAQAIGIPAFGVLAGLGVGGLAVALAIRPTLENLIAGVILYIDKPVRIGDFCSFDETIGTIEKIGLRSTQVRALDRTIVTVPNAAFADMKIINWARCDKMELRTTISLRYETEPDQLRYVLATLRKMCLSHPRIDNETVRVRFIDYGASSLDIEIRIYALTKEWNDFYAIREDVLLRVNELVRESGASFAFPSQTVYLSRDGKADQARGDAAVQQVQDWRRSGQLPFPHMAHSDRISLAGTLEYPPKGSPDAEISRILDTEEAEPLFKEPESDEEPAEREKQ